MTVNDTVLAMLRCPVCAASMQADEEGKSCRCTGTRIHSYDFARSGYLNLTRPGDGEGDLKEAVNARKLFLNAGYYEPLSNELNAILQNLKAETVLDAGCGEGYYTNRMAGNCAVLGVDLSRAGIDSAAKQAKQNVTGAAFAVGSIFSLPVRDASCDVVTNLFAPCCESEFLRVLKKGGYLILVGAGERHLMGLKQVLYENPYLNPGRADLPTEMKEVDRRRLIHTVTVEGRETIGALFSMTPYYWRTSEADRIKLRNIDTLQTELDFDIFTYQKGD
ncbi:MAG: methyltransferase domain-containing protein [Ruminococcaceae bacterium]|nr:methyltransferase domain-containing protein [Oscillospiraceae bacterium]